VPGKIALARWQDRGFRQRIDTDPREDQDSQQQRVEPEGETGRGWERLIHQAYYTCDCFGERQENGPTREADRLFALSFVSATFIMPVQFGA
jgi:hypothetical protein